MGIKKRSKSLVVPILSWQDSTRSCQVPGFCKKLIVWFTLLHFEYMLTYKAEVSNVKLKSYHSHVVAKKMIIK